MNQKEQPLHQQTGAVDRRSQSDQRNSVNCEDSVQISKAFVLNDLGEPDFDGHRKSYLRLIEAEKIMQEYKNEMTKRIIGWILAAVLGAMSSGLITWLKDHLK